jgi:hypothetical protein
MKNNPPQFTPLIGTGKSMDSCMRGHTACHLNWYLREHVQLSYKTFEIYRMHIISQCNSHAGLPELMAW